MNKYERFRLHDCIRTCHKLEHDLESYLYDMDDCKRSLKQIRDTVQDVYDAEMSRFREYITPEIYDRYYDTAQMLLNTSAKINVCGLRSEILENVRMARINIDAILDFDKSFGKYSTWYSGMRLDDALEEYSGRTVWNNPYNGTKEIIVTIVGLSYHCNSYELISMAYGNLLFLRREPNNPANPHAIVALKGARTIGYVRNSDLYILENLLPDAEMGSVACYVEELDGSAIRVRIPDIYNQQIEYMECIYDSIPRKNNDWNNCPTINFGIGIYNDYDGRKEIAAAEEVMRKSDRGTCQYMMSPDVAHNVVGLSRSFGPNAYYLGLELDLVKDYMTETGWGIVAELKEIDKYSLIDQNATLFKFSCELYKEYDHSIASMYH